MKKSVLNYVPSWTTCLTCLRALRVHLPYMPTCLLVFAPYVLSLFFMPYVPLFFYLRYVPSYFTYLTCLCFFSCLAFLVFFTCLTCLHFFKCFHFFVMPYVPWPFSIKCRTTLSQLRQPVISKNEIESSKNSLNKSEQLSTVLGN